MGECLPRANRPPVVEEDSDSLVLRFSGGRPGEARMLGDYQLATVVKAKKSTPTRARR